MSEDIRQKTAELVLKPDTKYYIFYLQDGIWGRTVVNAALEFLAMAHAFLGTELYQRIDANKGASTDATKEV